MTHTSTEQPEALRLAAFFESMRKSSHRWYDGTPVHEKAAAELRRLHASEQEYEQALQLLAGLHPCPTIDGPPMALAELIFDAVQADQRAFKDEIAKKERNLDWMHKELAKRAHGITQEQG